MAVTFNLMLAITYGLMVKTPTDVGRVHKVILNLMKDFFAPFNYMKKWSSSALSLNFKEK
jgi:hypothetical protein